MAFVVINNVIVLDNPAPFTNPLQFEITFDCQEELQDDLEWKVTYVGNAEDPTQDQVLEEVMVGPVPVGVNRFVLQAPAPNTGRIRNEDLIGVTVALLSCSYLDQKFVQIGYFINNEYAEPFEPEQYPNPVDITKLFRNILANEPRVTRFPINWTGRVEDAVKVESDGAAVVGGDDEPETEAMEEDEDEEEEDDDEEDDEDEDENAEVDLEDEEAEGDEDEEGESGDDEDDEVDMEEEARDEPHDLKDTYLRDGMEVMNTDSNSIDVARMLTNTK